MAMRKNEQVTEIDVVRLQTGRASFYLLGQSPLIYNAPSEKARQGLLLPSGRKTTVEKQSSLKHDPEAEFRGALYTSSSGPTLLTFLAVAFKRGLASAALDMGGAKRTQVDRLVWATGERIPVWGIPRLRMDLVRQSDMNRTPDIRTRACLGEWACKIDLTFVQPTLNHTVVANLLAAAGLVRGVGDFRQEKGAGNFGQFVLVNHDDADWNRIVAEGGREAQVEAVRNPVCYDEETEKLYTWCQAETRRRGFGANGKRSEVTS